MNESTNQETADEVAGSRFAEALWKEATDAAQAWCHITDEEFRRFAIYCYRSGYLKAKAKDAK